MHFESSNVIGQQLRELVCDWPSPIFSIISKGQILLYILIRTEQQDNLNDIQTENYCSNSMQKLSLNLEIDTQSISLRKCFFVLLNTLFMKLLESTPIVD